MGLPLRGFSPSPLPLFSLFLLPLTRKGPEHYAPAPAELRCQSSKCRSRPVALGRPLVKPLPRPLAVVLLPAAGPRRLPALPGLLPALALMAALRRRITPGTLGIRGSLPVAGSQHDLELVQLVPFGVGALPLGDRLQRLQPGSGGYRFRIVHSPLLSHSSHIVPGFPISPPTMPFFLK